MRFATRTYVYLHQHVRLHLRRTCTVLRHSHMQRVANALHNVICMLQSVGATVCHACNLGDH